MYRWLNYNNPKIIDSLSGKRASEMQMDICYGSSQRFGVPMNFGGPHAGFFSFRPDLTRFVPGRIITLSHDTRGELAYRMGIQTREQHIKRENATSNICTAQALLAVTNAFYAIYHQEEGLLLISRRINYLANYFAEGITKNNVEGVSLWDGYQASSQRTEQFALLKESFNNNEVSDNDSSSDISDQSEEQKSSYSFYDTVLIQVQDAKQANKELLEQGVSAYMIDNNTISFSFDETSTLESVQELLSKVLKLDSQLLLPEVAARKSTTFPGFALSPSFLPLALQNSETKNNQPTFREMDIFDKIKGEHELMRYITRLESKDISLCNSMISLGSCTMKLNSAVEMDRLFSKSYFEVHPFADPSITKGYTKIISELGRLICLITEMDGISFMSNSGATGEYLGIMAIDHFHKSRGNSHRRVCFIPESAHGTNPASAAKCGLEIVKIKNNEDGTVDMNDLNTKLDQYSEQLSLMMITYPSTFGVYEDGIKEIIEKVHVNGGLVYMDGANLNAQLGITSPGFLGADVCHLNLHKTFCIPHGGGGPGMGPICFKSHLVKHVTSHSKWESPTVLSSGEFSSPEGPHGVTSAPFSSASILSISYLYIRAMGFAGLRRCAIHAMLNANYLASRIGEKFPVKFGNKNEMCAHEFIIDISEIRAKTGVTEEDVAKRLIDFGFHAPTMSWPAAKTMMVEPTESENLAELDRFIGNLLYIISVEDRFFHF